MLLQGNLLLQVRYEGCRAGVLYLCLLVGNLCSQSTLEAEAGLLDVLPPGVAGAEDDVQLVV